MNFIKMQGTGNDYIFIEDFDNNLKDLSKLSIMLSDRHFGVGGDGIVIIRKSNVADAKMVMFNADGSEGKMCGNAIRCLAKEIFKNEKYFSTLGLSKSEIFNIKKGDGKFLLKIETLSGVKDIVLKINDGNVDSVGVNMGLPNFDKKKIPTLLNDEEILKIDDNYYKVCCISMGNPHCVVFMRDDVDLLDLEKLGKKFENHKVFPDRINTEFVNILSNNKFKIRVYERGSGETLSCGTGACAVVAVAIRKGIANPKKESLVRLKGGILKIKYTKSGLILKGDAKKVFEGQFEIEQ